MANIVHEIKVKASRDRVFAALATLDGLKSWHTARTEGTAGVGGIPGVFVPAQRRLAYFGML